MTPGALLSLLIVVPLISAALALILPSQGARRALALAIPAGGIAGGAWLISETAFAGKVLADNVGGFVGGVSIPLVADAAAAVMITATALIALGANWFADIVGETRARFYPALTLMLIGGVWGAVLTADLFNLFVFIEVMLMPSFGLLAMTGTWARLAVTRMFIIVNLVTSMILLSGVALVYAVVGTTNIAALAGAAGPRGANEFSDGVFGSQWQLIIPLGMVLLALAIKAGLAPMHTWLPRAYPGTSASVMALFSGLHTKVGVFAILRIFMTIFEGDKAWSWAIVALLAFGMIIGGFAGLAESTMRSVIAYQMVNGIPLMLIALAFLQNDATLMLSAALFYMIHHMIVAAALIMASGAIEQTYGTGKLRRLGGLLRRDPFVATIFAAGSLALLGFPPFSGMWGKLALFIGISQDGTWKTWVTLAAIVVSSIGSLLTMLYLWREVFWGKDMNSNEIPADLRVPAKHVLPAAGMMVASVAMFFAAGPVFNVITKAADGFTNTTNYVTSVLGPNPQRAVGVVVSPVIPSGIANVPRDAVSQTESDALREGILRDNQRDPKQYNSTDRDANSPGPIRPTQPGATSSRPLPAPRPANPVVPTPGAVPPAVPTQPAAPHQHPVPHHSVPHPAPHTVPHHDHPVPQPAPHAIPHAGGVGGHP